MEKTPPEQALADIIAGTARAVAAVCEALAERGAVPMPEIIDRLDRESAKAKAQPDLGPLGPAVIDAVLERLLYRDEPPPKGCRP